MWANIFRALPSSWENLIELENAALGRASCSSCDGWPEQATAALQNLLCCSTAGFELYRCRIFSWFRWVPSLTMVAYSVKSSVMSSHSVRDTLPLQWVRRTHHCHPHLHRQNLVIWSCIDLRFASILSWQGIWNRSGNRSVASMGGGFKLGYFPIATLIHWLHCVNRWRQDFAPDRIRARWMPTPRASHDVCTSSRLSHYKKRHSYPHICLFSPTSL